MNGRPPHLATQAFAIAAVFLIAGCTSIQRSPVPVQDMDRAIVSGMPDVRDWGDEPSEHFQEDLIQSVREEWEARGTGPGSQKMNALVRVTPGSAVNRR